MSVWCAVQSSLKCSALEQGQCSAASPALGGSSRVNCRRSLVPTAQLLTLTCSPLVSPSKPYQLVKYRSWTVILHLLVLIMEIMQNPSVRNLSANVVTIFPPQTAQLCYMGLAWLPYRDYRFSHILQFSTPAPLNPKLNPAMLNPWIPSCSIAAQFSAAGPTLVFQRHLKNVLLLSKMLCLWKWQQVERLLMSQVTPSKVSQFSSASGYIFENFKEIDTTLLFDGSCH